MSNSRARRGARRGRPRGRGAGPRGGSSGSQRDQDDHPPVDDRVRSGERRPRSPSTSTSSDERPHVTFTARDSSNLDDGAGTSRPPRSILRVRSHTQRRRRTKRMRRNIVFSNFDEVFYIPSRKLMKDEHKRILRHRMQKRNLRMRTRRGARVRKLVRGSNGHGPALAKEVKPRRLRRTAVSLGGKPRKPRKKGVNPLGVAQRRISRIYRRRKRAQRRRQRGSKEASRSPQSSTSSQRSPPTPRRPFQRSPPTPRRMPQRSPPTPHRHHPYHPMTHHPQHLHHRPSSPVASASDSPRPGSSGYHLLSQAYHVPVMVPSAAATALARETSESPASTNLSSSSHSSPARSTSPVRPTTLTPGGGPPSPRRTRTPSPPRRSPLPGHVNDSANTGQSPTYTPPPSPHLNPFRPRGRRGRRRRIREENKENIERRPRR